MLIKTKCFGEVEISEEKVITFETGLMGFEDYKKYTLLNNSEKESAISWLQSMEEETLAIPVINPLVIKEDYNPTIMEDVINPLGDLNDENVVILVTIRVPKDITQMTVNLKAPLIINADVRLGAQVIVDNVDYPVKYDIYEIVKQKKGES